MGCDIPLDADPSRYREVVERIKKDDAAAGALITTHKIGVFESSRDLFDAVDSYAELCGEAACLAHRGGRLLAFATDPVSSARALDEFFPIESRAEVLCLGGGGSATGITVQMLQRGRAKRITVVERDASRLSRIRSVHAKLDAAASVRYVSNADPSVNDRLVSELPRGSIVINATGLGKDVPGSPVTDHAVFPERGYAWDMNYRGDLQFLRQAWKQRKERSLHVEDGWRYFIHGWAVVLGRAFNIDVDADLTSRLARIATTERPQLA